MTAVAASSGPTSTDASRAPSLSTSPRAFTVALLGNPNCGKTTLFNAMTGLSAKTGNYPGITVERRTGVRVVDDVTLHIVDLPGTYSLSPRSDDEAVAVRALFGLFAGEARPDVVVSVVDGTALERHLYLTLLLRELGVPMVVAVTMTDTLAEDGRTVDVDALARDIGAPVFRASGTSRAEIDAFVTSLAHVVTDFDATPKSAPDATSSTISEVHHVNVSTRSDADIANDDDGARDRAHTAARSLMGVTGINSRAAATTMAHAWAHAENAPMLGLDAGVANDIMALRPVDGKRLEQTATARFARARAAADNAVQKAPNAPHEQRTKRIDSVVLHPILGPLILLGVFGLLFESLFSWANPLLDLIETIVGAVADETAAFIPESLPNLRSLVVNGVVAGVGNVIVFVPQIALLFLFLGILDDTGYLARAAFILDRLMAKVGLHGRAFVPLLSGFACAVPAIMATRTIENEKDRLVTILVTPLVSCSARLPVYSLVIATLFSDAAPIFGVLHVGTVLFFAMYALGTVAAIGMAAVFKRTLLKSPTPPLVLELPPYRLPMVRPLLRHVSSRIWVFIRDAGTVILAITIILWALFSFPRHEVIETAFEEKRRNVDATAFHTDEEKVEALANVDAALAKARLAGSAAGTVGHFLEPVLAPLGFDWKLSVGVLASFAAREVLVSTLGLVYGLGDGTDEESVSLRDAMTADVDELTGKKKFTPLVGLSLMVFFVLAMQCMSTLATTKRETRSWKWPTFQFAYMTALAYAASFLVFQVGSWLGFS